MRAHCVLGDEEPLCDLVCPEMLVEKEQHLDLARREHAGDLLRDTAESPAFAHAVEHYQKAETIWNGHGGNVVFFQNEMPYDPPSQSAWQQSPGDPGWPALKVADSVTSFSGFGMGSYSFFNQGVGIENSMAFQAPDTAGVKFHDLLTVFLNGSGGIESVINGQGTAVSPTSGGPSDVVSYP